VVLKKKERKKERNNNPKSTQTSRRRRKEKTITPAPVLLLEVGVLGMSAAERVSNRQGSERRQRQDKELKRNREGNPVICTY
jgi:hypothetical protein